MKNNIVTQSAPAFTPAVLSAVGRFQIYRESRGEVSAPGFSTDSDAKIKEAFMLQAPTYDGADIRALDQSGQRMIAFVKWNIVRTEIARDLLKQKKISDMVEMRF